MKLEGKDITVLGIGRSGRAAARLASTRGARVRVLDSGDPGKLKGLASDCEAMGFEVIVGDAADRAEGDPDLVIVSPGIDAGWPIAAQFAGTKAEVIGELEFAFRFWDGDVIGITGTNGKTTTTELVSEFLNAGGISTEPAGNHGKPFSEVVLERSDSVTATLEISSFQLETITSFAADIAVWLNFAPDHLDRYSSLEDYRNAKLRLFENRDAASWTVHRLGEELPAPETRSLTFNAFETGGDYHFDGRHVCREGRKLIDLSETRLRGLHNAENLMAAMAVADLKGVGLDDVRRAASTYSPPPHRNEFAGEVQGRTFINDSKATNLHALESSLRGCPEKVVLIAGGKEKGLPFVNLKELVASKASNVVLIGEIRESVAKAWGDSAPCCAAKSLEQAVETAYEAAERGQTILFSPGTSSFDMFSGYEERGRAFLDAVQSLK